MEPEVHIAGLLVQTLPEQRPKVAKALSDWPRTEVRAGSPTGKLVVLWEGGSGDELTASIARIRQLPGVLNVALVYQHVENARAMAAAADEAEA
ncbi:MAG: putative NapD protein [Rhodocyclaceae bacterium]|nr:putative NapD protein [Rhodocyclaceae bacterium]